MRRFISATGRKGGPVQRYERRPGPSTFLEVIDDPPCRTDNAPIRHVSSGGTGVNHQSLRMDRRLGLGVLAAGLFTPVAQAHHGFGNFAMDEDITLSGVVTKIDFVNPHSWVHFDVTTPDGTKRVVAELVCHEWVFDRSRLGTDESHPALWR